MYYRAGRQHARAPSTPTPATPKPIAASTPKTSAPAPAPTPAPAPAPAPEPAPEPAPAPEPQPGPSNKRPAEEVVESPAKKTKQWYEDGEPDNGFTWIKAEAVPNQKRIQGGMSDDAKLNIALENANIRNMQQERLQHMGINIRYKGKNTPLGIPGNGNYDPLDARHRLAVIKVGRPANYKSHMTLQLKSYIHQQELAEKAEAERKLKEKAEAEAKQQETQVQKPPQAPTSTAAPHTQAPKPSTSKHQETQVQKPPQAHTSTAAPHTQAAKPSTSHHKKQVPQPHQKAHPPGEHRPSRAEINYRNVTVFVWLYENDKERGMVPEGAIKIKVAKNPRLDHTSTHLTQDSLWSQLYTSFPYISNAERTEMYQNIIAQADLYGTWEHGHDGS